MKFLILIGGIVIVGLCAFAVYWIANNVSVKTTLNEEPKSKPKHTPKRKVK